MANLIATYTYCTVNITLGERESSLVDKMTSLKASPPPLRRRTTVQQVAAVSTDVTRRMICGGLAGMIAKVRTI